ncbi:GrpB family protein [Chamaesiphon sp. VAR_48_metabat_135_sub]|uniref:GrpB family protein n=1 Tax=Chamaesiphon sp. VAR_48_metabat_135_sub TaxID=2964699 RepID=UPI00286C46C5|nr:GrpB family protein [Chamaesiphon sp. VAR_48_metabat_135_sub]
MTRKVEVVPHNPNWRTLFETESKQITIALVENVIAIHHIGSTSIETIYAKPIIDILVEVSSISKVDENNSQMQALGYQCMGEFGIKDRRFFLKDNPAGIRTHHVHVFEVDSPQVKRHLAFRDYLNNHLEDAESYSALKQSLGSKYPHDIEGYMDGKHGFIQEIDRKAAEWHIKLSS